MFSYMLYFVVCRIIPPPTQKASSEMYKEILLFPSYSVGQIIYPDMARKLVALACNGLAIDPAIFNRDANGKTLQGAPPKIIFDGGNGFIRIYGIGKSGSDLLTSQAMNILSGLSDHFNSPVRLEVRTGEMSLKQSAPSIYTAHRLVMSKKPKKVGQLWNQTIAQSEKEIKEEILTGLLSYAQYLDDDSGGESMLEGRIPKQDSFFLDILEGEFTPIEIIPGISAAGFKNLTFATDLELNGPWAVGKLRSRGHGLIRRRIR